MIGFATCHLLCVLRILSDLLIDFGFRAAMPSETLCVISKTMVGNQLKVQPVE